MIDYKKKLHFDDVLIVPKKSNISSRRDVELTAEYYLSNSKKILFGYPLIVSNMDTTGTMQMAQALYHKQVFVSLHKYYDTDALVKFFNTKYCEYSFYTLGMRNDDLAKFDYVYKNSSSIDKVCIDVANAYLTSFHDFIKRFRDSYPHLILMAGNVCTPEGVCLLLDSGVDIVKCGIANGGVCDTKNKAAIGYPQFSMIIECVDAAKTNGKGLICSDGGCKSPADVCKALAAGAHFVMAGSLFAGYDENEGEWVYEREKIWNENLSLGDAVCIVTEKDVKKKLKFYGMSSKTANEKYNGGLAHYRTSEGKETYIPYKGMVSDLMQDISGGLASCCTYTNSASISELPLNSNFILV